MTNCLFCKIARKEIPATFLLENETVFAIKDVNPQAPEHMLVIPKAHHENLNQVESSEVLAKLMKTVQEISARFSNGYRVVINTGSDGGQSVGHLHVHVLGGRPLAWPPG
jgi:histidine triad (HIT) family protein